MRDAMPGSPTRQAPAYCESCGEDLTEGDEIIFLEQFEVSEVTRDDGVFIRNAIHDTEVAVHRGCLL